MLNEICTAGNMLVTNDGISSQQLVLMSIMLVTVGSHSVW